MCILTMLGALEVVRTAYSAHCQIYITLAYITLRLLCHISCTQSREDDVKISTNIHTG